MQGRRRVSSAAAACIPRAPPTRAAHRDLLLDQVDGRGAIGAPAARGHGDVVAREQRHAHARGRSRSGRRGEGGRRRRDPFAGHPNGGPSANKTNLPPKNGPSASQQERSHRPDLRFGAGKWMRRLARRWRAGSGGAPAMMAAMLHSRGREVTTIPCQQQGASRRTVHGALAGGGAREAAGAKDVVEAAAALAERQAAIKRHGCETWA